ncbi:MAG: OFA family MFS transporter [Bacteroidetes bacterium]|nr:OFA family MFS transporter [Bacteroidota bacterium]MDA1122065.1 OFA family MFS transporter [Bacteroidota bacterium]
MALFSFLDKEHSLAKPGHNRWLIPPAALAIHLCIGQIYAYSVFNRPMTQVIGITESTDLDWKLTTLGWIFSMALFTLGASAAIFGKWLEQVGPRMAMFVSAICFSGGFFVAALGVYSHQIWLVYLGHGFLGGIGLGLGYISPVSTLIKWFPDKPGMATGMAIMGFGGGAMIASPLSVMLMDAFRSINSIGVAETFLCMGAIYLTFMMFGVFTIRIPSRDWKPAGWQPGITSKNSTEKNSYVGADGAVRTFQFYLLFAVLMLNVTAGIGVLGQASVMIQEMFSVESVGEERAVNAAVAGGFVGLLSLFNMVGRFLWSSLSDRIGRKNTYHVFFLLGTALYVAIPTIGDLGSILFFVVFFGIIITMYGGGFATIPAYLADLFGTSQVGAIHGRLLLAWSAAAILGPVLVNYIRAYQIETLLLPPAEVYSITMYIMAGLLIIGFISNSLVKPVAPEHFIAQDLTADMLTEINNSKKETSDKAVTNTSIDKFDLRMPIAWIFVGIPLLWGVTQTLIKSLALFI